MSARFALPYALPFFMLLFVFFNGAAPAKSWALSSTNLPLDSPVYSYLEKLAGFGLISSDVKGIRPFSKAEAARLLLEAEGNLPRVAGEQHAFADALLRRIRETIPREVSLRRNDNKKPPFFDYNLISALRFRYVYLDGLPRDYERPVHDPGHDGVFGIGSALRPANPYPSVVQQRGSEGTPLLENNNGVIFDHGSNGELRWAAEAYFGDSVAALLEPSLVASNEDTRIRLNRGYAKVGGGALELEVGKDENWLGLGYRGNVTLTSNAENLTQIKLSSPEPFHVGWLSWLGDLKYSLIASRFDKTDTGGVVRQPWFYAVKLVSKPAQNLEVGFNLARQQGGPGVDNSAGATIRGLIGGTGADNSNSLAGFELRYRLPWLRNTELYGEFSGEDTAAFWPIVESYVAGFYIPRLTNDGKDDLRFEFFQGNQILYTNGTFPGGYLYEGMPLGHSQGGATQDFFVRYSHWFAVRNHVALEFIHTNRGKIGKVNGQSTEYKNAGRIFWDLPLYGEFNLGLMYGLERIRNLDLESGVQRTNQLLTAILSYRY